jgi:hypothetical protein
MDLTPHRELSTPLAESPFVGAVFRSREIERFSASTPVRPNPVERVRPDGGGSGLTGGRGHGKVDARPDCVLGAEDPPRELLEPRSPIAPMRWLCVTPELELLEWLESLSVAVLRGRHHP